MIEALDSSYKTSYIGNKQRRCMESLEKVTSHEEGT